jgi:dihydroorotase
LQLVAEGALTLHQAISRLSSSPAQALSLPGGRLQEGGPADVTVIDMARAWSVEPRAFLSRSRNTPFAGRVLPGRAVLTILGGRVSHRLQGD